NRSTSAFPSGTALLSLRTSAAALTAGRPWTIAVLALPALRRVLARTSEPRRSREGPLRAARPGAASAAVTLAAAARTRASAAAIAVELAPSASARLAHGEVGSLALGHLSFRARQRGANQPSMHRPVVFGHVLVRVGVVLAVLAVLARRRVDRLLGARLDGRGLGSHLFDKGCLVLCLFLRVFLGLFWHIGRYRGGERVFLPAGRGDARLLVLMDRVTRRAARLLHLVVDHRDDRMVGDAALTRTVVVQNVTEPKPALLHELPRSRSFSGGIQFR